MVVISPRNASSLTASEYYMEETDGVYSKKNGAKGNRLTNATVRIIGVEEHRSAEHDPSQEMLICAVRCEEAWGDIEREIIVSREEFKQLFRHLHRKYPEVFESVADPDARSAYLSEVFQRDYANAPRKVRPTLSGWLEAYGSTRYYVGEDAFYAQCAIPDITGRSRLDLFLDGTAFLDVGHGNDAIIILWLTGHVAFSRCWLSKGGVAFRSTVFFKGATGLHKTSTVSEMANVFDDDRSHAVIRMTSTPALIRETMIRLKDQVCVVDDFSNTEASSRKQSENNAEYVIRAVGDGIFPGHMSVKDFSQPVRQEVCCVAVLTGEEELGLGQSSDYRTIVVPVMENTFDPQALTRFQQNRSIVQRYFALYIEFLTNYGAQIAQNASGWLGRYRAELGDRLRLPRLIDAAAVLCIQADIWAQFAAYCGMDSDFIQKVHTQMQEAIVRLVHANVAVSREKALEWRFLFALWQSLGTKPQNGLAEDERAYTENEAGFIGFRERAEGLIWLRFNDAWMLVARYYQGLGESWLAKEGTVKKLLLKKGLSAGRLAPEGQSGNEYLRRARLGSRKRMLVLYEEAVEKLLNENKEDIL